MPFTLSHPAAVLPLHRVARGRLPLSALIIGSMMPDLVYFLPMGVNGRFSHTTTGVFLFCLPAGILAWLMFHALLKRPLVSLLPDPVVQRIPETAMRPVLPRGGPLQVLLAIVLGSFTHVIWDAFTHGQTPVVRHFAVLQMPVLVFDGYSFRLYKILQHLSTLFGLAVLSYACWQWWRQTPASHRIGGKMAYSLLASVLSMIATLTIVFGTARVQHATTSSFEALTARAAVGALAGAAFGILLYALAWHAVHVIWFNAKNRASPAIRNVPGNEKAGSAP